MLAVGVGVGAGVGVGVRVGVGNQSNDGGRRSNGRRADAAATSGLLLRSVSPARHWLHRRWRGGRRRLLCRSLARDVARPRRGAASVRLLVAQQRACRCVCCSPCTIPVAWCSAGMDHGRHTSSLGASARVRARAARAAQANDAALSRSLGPFPMQRGCDFLPGLGTSSNLPRSPSACAYLSPLCLKRPRHAFVCPSSIIHTHTHNTHLIHMYTGYTRARPSSHTGVPTAASAGLRLFCTPHGCPALPVPF